MIFQSTAIAGVKLISPTKLGDVRGYFMETFRKEFFWNNIGTFDFVQDNQSMSAQVGTIRGLHFQVDPRAQGKLVSCIHGALLDVAVDIRTGSPTYGQFISEELSAENACQLWVPPGFAHGFCTLKPYTVVSYKVTDYYSPAHDRGLLWNDPAIGIEWPVSPDKATVSEKDQKQPLLSDLGDVFTYAPSPVEA